MSKRDAAEKIGYVAQRQDEQLVCDTVRHELAFGMLNLGYGMDDVKLRSAEVLLCEDGSHKLIRRAETPKDYFATFDFSEFDLDKNE